MYKMVFLLGIFVPLHIYWYVSKVVLVLVGIYGTPIQCHFLHIFYTFMWLCIDVCLNPHQYQYYFSNIPENMKGYKISIRKAILYICLWFQATLTLKIENGLAERENIIISNYHLHSFVYTTTLLNYRLPVSLNCTIEEYIR
jgi:hypothetical membrane protein